MSSPDGTTLAAPNRAGLSAAGRDTERDALVPLRTREAGPPVGLLQQQARSLRGFDLEAMVGKFDPERITMRQRARMRRDPMIAFGLHYKKVPLINAPYRFECEDPRVREFVWRAYDRIHVRLMVQMLMCLDWGYQPIVKRFQREVPTWTFEPPDEPGVKQTVWPWKDVPSVTWKEPQALPPEGAEVLFSADGRSFDGFKHHNLKHTMDGTDPLRVRATHALWVTHQRDENHDWYGWPLTGYAFRYWWSYWYRWLLADRHFEQDADPPLIVDYPPGRSPDPRDPTQTLDNFEVAMTAGVDVRDGATVAMPSDYYEVEGAQGVRQGQRKWDMRFLRGGENMQVFQASFDYLDTMKIRSLWIPEQALFGAKGSLSGNVADAYGAQFAESGAILMGEMDRHINEHMVSDLVAQNFVNAPPCRKVTEGFREEDMGLVNELVKTIASQDPGSLQVDWRKMAEVAKLPLLDPAEIERRAAEEMERQKVADAGEQAGREAAIVEEGGGGNSPPGE